jgi:hypothetical protein
LALLQLKKNHRKFVVRARLEEILQLCIQFLLCHDERTGGIFFPWDKARPYKVNSSVDQGVGDGGLGKPTDVVARL